MALIWSCEYRVSLRFDLPDLESRKGQQTEANLADLKVVLREGSGASAKGTRVLARKGKRQTCGTRLRGRPVHSDGGQRKDTR